MARIISSAELAAMPTIEPSADGSNKLLRFDVSAVIYAPSLREANSRLAHCIEIDAASMDLDSAIRGLLLTDNPKEAGGAWSTYDLATALDVESSDVEGSLARIDPYRSYVGGTSVYLYWLAPLV